MKYYQIDDDLEIPNRWTLGELNLPEEYAWDDIDKKSLIHSIKWEVKVLLEGKPLDVTFVDFGLIVCTLEFIDFFHTDDIDYEKINVIGTSNLKQRFLVSVKKEIDCVDKEKSKFKLWAKNNPVRPDLAGTYEYFTNLKINPIKVGNETIFRLKGYEVAQIVSEEVKEKCEGNNIQGITFSPV